MPRGAAFVFELRAVMHYLHRPEQVGLVQITSRGEFGQIHLATGYVLEEVPRATCEALNRWLAERLDVLLLEPPLEAVKPEEV